MIEYKKITMVDPPTEKELNMLGVECWDMCGIIGNTVFFKRPAKVKEEPQAKQKDAVKSRK